MDEDNAVSQTDSYGAGATRRDFLKGLSASALLPGLGSESLARAAVRSHAPDPATRRPNIVLYIADQVRWDCIGAYGLNPTTRTPNLDQVAERGVSFSTAVTNQPLCSPSRACMLTGRYATETGMWKLNLELNHSLPTLATVLRANGYTANFIGKWHLAPIDADKSAQQGFVPPEQRGGFLDLWEAANALEMTSHPYAGTIWDGNGQPIHFEDEYRVDFLTDRALRFLRQPQEKPFLLCISQLEPHHQNDEDRFVAPNGYAERYQNPFVPPDLLRLPGDWQQQLPAYYGAIERIDESVGKILQALEAEKLLDNTIFVFTSDHGCHFRTRNSEYKRSPHDASIRIPLLMQGPGLDASLKLDQVVGNRHLTPTLLHATGAPIPPSMSAQSLLPLIRDPEARRSWPNQELIQISESMVARALRTREWTYCVADPALQGGKTSSSLHYVEYQMYNNFGDPAQLVNLTGRTQDRAAAAQLRGQLLAAIQESGEAAPAIEPARLYL